MVGHSKFTWEEVRGNFTIAKLLSFIASPVYLYYS